MIPFVNIIAFLALLVLGLGLIVPGIAVSVRRLHDTNKSGWWLLLCFVPFVGSIVILVFMCLEGTKGANKYGDEFFLPEEKRLKTDLLNSELKKVTKFLLCFECCLSIQAFNHKLIDIQGSNWRNELF